MRPATPRLLLAIVAVTFAAYVALFRCIVEWAARLW